MHSAPSFIQSLQFAIEVTIHSLVSNLHVPYSHYTEQLYLLTDKTCLINIIEHCAFCT